MKSRSKLLPRSKNTHAKAKKKAWDAFSVFIRTREADWKGDAKCFTCGFVYPWKQMDAGHFRHGVLDFDEENVNVQCKRCNGPLRGNGAVYCYKMLEKYGQEVVDRIMAFHGTQKYTVADYEAIEADYKERIKNL